MLELAQVHAHYGKSHVLQGVDLTVGDGEAVALLGRNGVGKTTTLRTIMRLTPATGGAITFDGARLDRVAPDRIAGHGVGYVPQGRRIFPRLTVWENLCLGLARDPDQAALAHIFERFPVLKERLRQAGGTLSGGEQQQLAIARCLAMKPKLLLLDEPTEGIMPRLVTAIRREIRSIHASGVSILLVEQNVRTALAVCDRVYIMEKGVISYRGTAAELRANPDALHRYLGVSI
ncbi:MAG TPA: ABC transporter ATP-binding protein [Methylomirabilota bacterium]|nr:ABC transporter ATP-binding protein [Methylomirabilota bacterium]